MKTYSPLVVPDLTRQLVAAGFLPEDAHPAPPRVLIAQVGGILENSAFDADRGYGTGYSLSLYIAVDLPALTIWEWKLDLPWEAPRATGKRFSCQHVSSPWLRGAEVPTG
jgi:hypothetical protein